LIFGLYWLLCSCKNRIVFISCELSLKCLCSLYSVQYHTRKNIIKECKKNNNNLPTYLPIPWKPESGRGNKDMFNVGLIFYNTLLWWAKCGFINFLRNRYLYWGQSQISTMFSDIHWRDQYVTSALLFDICFNLPDNIVYLYLCMLVVFVIRWHRLQEISGSHTADNIYYCIWMLSIGSFIVTWP
jgi:hypothetical protein